MFRHSVLKNPQAIDNSGKGTLYYNCILFNLGAGLFGLFVASYGWRIRDRMSRRGLRRSRFDQDARSRLVNAINIAIYTSGRMFFS